MSKKTWGSTDANAIQKKYMELINARYAVEVVVSYQDAERFRSFDLRSALQRFYQEQNAAPPMKKVAMILVWDE